jgi:hypothetical protein
VRDKWSEVGAEKGRSSPAYEPLSAGLQDVETRPFLSQSPIILG